MSATFTDFPTSNADLADDFVVPAGQTWNVQSIDAEGTYFNGSGPAIDWNVFFMQIMLDFLALRFTAPLISQSSKTQARSR